MAGNSKFVAVHFAVGEDSQRALSHTGSWFYGAVTVVFPWQEGVPIL